MNYMERMISNVRDFYKDINQATLTGAIDVVVVEQPDGSYNCSPFHVRFGKLGVLRSKEKVVDIEINGIPRDIHMKLGESGEAFFVEELEDSDDLEIPDNLATSPIPVSELENIFSQTRRRSFDLGTEAIASENQVSDYSKRRNTADNNTSKTVRERDFLKRHIGLGNIDIGETSGDDLTLSMQSTTVGPSSEDISKNDVSETIFKMDSLENEPSLADTDPKTSLQTTPTESISETTKSSKRRRRKMKKKNAPRRSSSNNQLPTEGAEKTGESATEKSSLTSSNSESEIKETQSLDEQASGTNRKILDPDIHFFSDTELTAGGNTDSRNNSTLHLIETVQSDSEIEMKNRKDSENDDGRSWEWGGFPQNQNGESENCTKTEEQQKMSMIATMFSFMKTKHISQKRNQEGVYLTDITSGNLDPETAELYFPRSRKPQGNGPSLAQSPNSVEGSKSVDSDFDEQNKLAQTYINDISISSCGWTPEPNPDRFLENVISFSDLCNNPTILESERLVVRIKDKYYNWKVAAPLIASLMIYHRPLPQSSIDQLCNVHMPSTSKSTSQNKIQAKQEERYSWWSWRRSRSSRETTPVVENAEEITDPTGDPSLDEQNKQQGEIKDQEKEAGTPEDSKNTDLSYKSTKDEVSESQSQKAPEKYRKTLRLSSKQIVSLDLQDGINEVDFSVTTAYQGTSRCKCFLYKWKWDDKIVISDIDGTITKSDVLGHILPIVGNNWAQKGVAQLFHKIADNGYKLLYLSARAIGQARVTRDYLKSIKQEDVSMPAGPVLLNPTSLILAFHREVIEKKPEQFKIQCLTDIKALFPSDSHPFYAGYGNKINDVYAYSAVGIPIERIFTINPKGELKHELTQTFQSSYSNMSFIVDQLYPSRVEPANDYSQFIYWRDPITPLDELPEL
ncbi:phosphatidate phosphatase LPIN2 isoform X2 [Coccinella septempunctata]|uniref:phosphatidate phosphatase LPIN2 isoform X2 n=1 Tax=Coccinella septempunctata TaxID=41139 RepID=UPI001D07F0C2|nr:phosphatidate phosphatase LPIN2 isoform X2 [Coccinella septempunctata]